MTFDVLIKFKSKDSNEIQSLNNACIYLTFFVSNFVIMKLLSLIHPENISLMSSTFGLSKLDKFIETKDEHPLNIDFISVTP